MKIELVLQSIPDLLPMTNRSPGAHVSHIIHDLCIRRKHYKKSTSPADMTRLQLGCALETAITNRYQSQYPDRYISIGELCLNHIYGTPDMIDIINLSVHEIKLTWMSSRHDHTSVKFWKYLVQLKAYCYMVGTVYGFLHVGYVNGDYDNDFANRNPVYRVWKCVFSEMELVNNWRMLFDHGVLMGIVDKPNRGRVFVQPRRSKPIRRHRIAA